MDNTWSNITKCITDSINNIELTTANLNENSTMKDIEDFLFFHMDSADKSKSIVNPVFTKEDIWNIHNKAITTSQKNNTELSTNAISAAVRNLTREFGSYYEF